MHSFEFDDIGHHGDDDMEAEAGAEALEESDASRVVGAALHEGDEVTVVERDGEKH